MLGRDAPRRALERRHEADLLASSGLSFSAVRVTEMALQTKDARPASIIRLLDAGSQVKTSGVMDSL